jgi:hypothetical protein
VYYARRGSLIKIGTTTQLRPRMLKLRIEELLAVEPGYYDLERQRHAQFAEFQIVIKRQGKPNEWYVPARALLRFARELRAAHGLPDLSRWEAAQLAPGEREGLALLPPLVMTVRPWTLERFASGLTIGTGGECWPRRVTDFTNGGYGRIYFEGRLTGAHRASYQMFVGPIPEGLVLDHMCHDPDVCKLDKECPHRGCVNPAHLEPKTSRENGLRGGGASAVHARQTHCKRGHEFTDDNIYPVKGGGRQCKTCSREASLARSSGKKCGDAQRERTHCKNGHEYTPENIFYSTRRRDGLVIRQCKTCRQASTERWKAKRDAALLS